MAPTRVKPKNIGIVSFAIPPLTNHSNSLYNKVTNALVSETDVACMWPVLLDLKFPPNDNLDKVLSKPLHFPSHKVIVALRGKFPQVFGGEHLATPGYRKE